MSTLSTPQGLPTFRRNNPGNLRFVPSIKWVGQTGSDGGFAVFSETIYGIRAMVKDLQNDYLVDGDRTIRRLITQYAPPNENNTAAYVNYISRKLERAPDEELPYTDIPLLSWAMAEYESGKPIARTIWLDAVRQFQEVPASPPPAQSLPNPRSPIPALALVAGIAFLGIAMLRR